MIKSAAAHVILLDAATRVLPTFPEDLSRSAERQLKQMEVDVRVGAKVLEVTAEGVQLEGEFIKTRTVVWAAGNAANPLGRDLHTPTDQQGRIIVNPDLTVKGHAHIYAIGDMVSFSYQTGKPLAGIAPVAMQMGTCAAQNILLNIEAKPPSRFKYRDKGYMATIGRNRAVADLKIIRFGGFLAWLSWLFIHLLFLVGLRYKVQVFLQWVWAYFTFSRGARLVYGQFRPVKPPETDSFGKTDSV
ncbi:MAG: FAD-dependent oxidoreductase [Verrucomicrobia bacterium]|nr:FAD-dependent oxidoreductase [Verrucomicrobiota bacterium]